MKTARTLPLLVQRVVNSARRLRADHGVDQHGAVCGALLGGDGCICGLDDLATALYALDRAKKAEKAKKTTTKRGR